MVILKSVGLLSSLIFPALVLSKKTSEGFDTTFMFLGCAITFISIYQKRHIAPHPMKVYTISGLLIFFNTLSLLYASIKNSRGGSLG